MTSSIPIIVIGTVSLDSVGGIETYVRNVVQGFYDTGWQVHCVATNRRGDAFDRLGNGIVWHDLSTLPLNPNKVFAAAKLVNRINPDILLLNNCSLLHYALPILNSSIKTVVVLHSDDARFYNVAALFARRICRWVAPTPGLASSFRKYLPSARRVAVRHIPHGVSEERFYSEKFKQGGNPTITFVGFMAINKGADLLPEIMGQVITYHPNARLNVVGYGPLIERLKEDFSELGLDGQCVFTGPLSPQRIAEVLATSDIFLLPTRIEGFGLAIAEAMMSGAVPVVSRLVEITDTIVTHNETGMLVEVDDIEGFSSAIINLLSNPARLSSMKKAAQKDAREKFSLQRMIYDYKRLFEEEDDRPVLPRCGVVGWAFETIREMMKKSPDGTFRLQKKLGTVKSMIVTFAAKTVFRDANARMSKK